MKVELTVDQIRDISQYAHWIPITRGYHREYLDENFPGWNWNDFLPVLDRAGLVMQHVDGHKCLRLRQGICMVLGVTRVELSKSKAGARVTSIS